MTDLPELRPASCGHGFLPIDTEPAGWWQNGQQREPVYECEDCRARRHGPRVETKEVEVATRKVQYQLPRNPELEADVAPVPSKPPPDWEADGRTAALSGSGRTLPAALRDQHPRSSGPRAWFRGYDVAKVEA